MQTATAIKPESAPMVTPESIRTAIRRTKEDGVSLYQIAVEAGIPIMALDQWLEDCSYGLDVGQVKRLQTWLAGDDNTAPGVALDKTTFVETATARKITDALEYARHTPAIVVIYGGAGVGKTVALRHYQANQHGVVLISAAQCRQTPAAMMTELAHATGLNGRLQKADALFRDILFNLGMANVRLLVVDEAQHLKTPTYDAFRTFFDEIGIGIAYVGNEEVYSRIGGKKRVQLPQIYSRVGMRLHVARPEPDDVDALLEAHSLCGRDVRSYAQRVAVLPGGLRGLDHVIRQAKLAAVAVGGDVNAALLKAAAMALGILEAA